MIILSSVKPKSGNSTMFRYALVIRHNDPELQAIVPDSQPES
jgi:hypothetical protein